MALLPNFKLEKSLARFGSLREEYFLAVLENERVREYKCLEGILLAGISASIRDPFTLILEQRHSIKNLFFPYLEKQSQGSSSSSTEEAIKMFLEMEKKERPPHGDRDANSS